MGNAVDKQVIDQSPEESISQLRVQLDQLKEVEEKLRKSENSLKEAEYLAQMGHWEFHIAKGELTWSDEIYRIFDLDPARFVPSYDTFLDSIHPADREMVAAAFNFSLENKTPYNIIHRLQLARGEIKFVQEVCQTTYDSNGDPLVSFGTVQDITEKILHDELVQQTNRLESLGILASGIAQDFNKALVGILGNIDLVLGDLNANDPNFNLLENARNAAVNAQAFTRQLTTFTKGSHPVCEPTDLGQLIQETMGLFTSGTGTSVDWDIPEKLWVANVDPLQIKQVFQNLTINAIEAMPDGGVISVSMNNRPAGNSVFFKDAGITIRFSDSGPGICDDDAGSVFDPYFSQKKMGKGLGLAVVESVIAKHDGQIYLDRESGHLSLFVINIPVPAL